MSLQALTDILAERVRQDAKWGVQNHDPFTYMTILTEEVGESAQAALKLRFDHTNTQALRDELVQVAAVALAMVECLDRNTWVWPVAPGASGPASTPAQATPLVELRMTNHGIDGWDAKTTTVATFTSTEKAMQYLRDIGYDFPQWGSFYARDVDARNCMGAISFQFREQQPVPVNPVGQSPS